MDYRIEVGCPVFDEDAKQMIIDLVELQFQDTLKARVIDENQTNEYVKRGNRKNLRSQIQTHEYLTKKEEL
jgi:polyphosphate kinase